MGNYVNLIKHRFSGDARSEGRKAKDRLEQRQFGYTPTVANTPSLGGIDGITGATISQDSARRREKARAKKKKKNK